MTRIISRSLIFLIGAFILRSCIFAQSLEPFPHGLALEFGGGQNDLYWSGNGPRGPFGFTPLNRTDFHLTPNIRFTYETQLTNRFALLPFLGYNQFGGTSNQDGYLSQYSFHALELGFVGLYKIANVSFGAGFKEKLNLYVQYDEPRPLVHDDYTKLFPTWSDNLGIRTSYCVDPITFSIESWFGMSNLATFPASTTVRENHYRIFVAYTL